MSELTRSLVLAGAFVAFILAVYLQEGGSWARSTEHSKVTSSEGQHGGSAELKRGHGSELGGGAGFWRRRRNEKPRLMGITRRGLSGVVSTQEAGTGAR